MGVKAEWRLAELEVDAADDPFDTVILTTGIHVDLSGGEEAVHDAISQTIRLESRLFDQGVTCDLKDGGQDCLTCPVFTDDPTQRIATLCSLGRDQQVLCKRADRHSGERARPYLALGNSFCMEASLADRASKAMGLDAEVLALA